MNDSRRREIAAFLFTRFSVIPYKSNTPEALTPDVLAAANEHLYYTELFKNCQPLNYCHNVSISTLILPLFLPFTQMYSPVFSDTFFRKPL